MTQAAYATTLAQALRHAQALGLDRLDAQLLLLHALERPTHDRAWLLAHDTDDLPAVAAAVFEASLQRRLRGEPVAYLTGHKEFFGLDLCVDARVLVPRPDTETLVEWALALLPTDNAPAKTNANANAAQRVLDLGTGSGAIALALKASRPDLQVFASDFSAEALAVAQANAQRLHLNLQFCQGVWLEALPPGTAPFFLIVSNPPYIAAEDHHLAALRHEPLHALASGTDGLRDLRLITAQAPAHLQAGGWLLLEHGYDQAGAVRELLLAAGFSQVQSRRDLQGIERCSGGQWLEVK
jgi:release factor glutamine methyltransferase